MALPRKTVEKLNEWLLWYNHHAEKIGSQPLETQVKWLLKASNGAYEAISLLARALNDEDYQNKRGSHLILPPGVRFNRD